MHQLWNWFTWQPYQMTFHLYFDDGEHVGIWHFFMDWSSYIICLGFIVSYNYFMNNNWSNATQLVSWDQLVFGQLLEFQEQSLGGSLRLKYLEGWTLVCCAYILLLPSVVAWYSIGTTTWLGRLIKITFFSLIL